MTQFSYSFALKAGMNSGIGSRLTPGLIPGSPNITSEMIFGWTYAVMLRVASRITKAPCDVWLDGIVCYFGYKTYEVESNKDELLIRASFTLSIQALYNIIGTHRDSKWTLIRGVLCNILVRP